MKSIHPAITENMQNRLILHLHLPFCYGTVQFGTVRYENTHRLHWFIYGRCKATLASHELTRLMQFGTCKSYAY